MILNKGKTMKKIEDLKPYHTLGLPLLLLMSIFMVLGIVGAVIVNFYF